MNRYQWLQKEIEVVPRKKFYVFEPRTLSDLKQLEERYGRLPCDYREFVQSFGKASLFRSKYNRGHYLEVFVPPVLATPGSVSRRGHSESKLIFLILGYHINTDDAWLEWADGKLLHGGAVVVGVPGRRRKAGPFEQWLKLSFTASKKLYSREEWEEIRKPVLPFSANELQILEALPRFSFGKVGVTPGNSVLVEVENQSSLELPCLTVGVRGEDGMTGAVALQTKGILPGAKKTIEQSIYRASMDPRGLGLFRLPLPDPEDRPYYSELRGSVPTQATGCG